MLEGNLELMDCILGEPDYELQYYDDKIIVTGHTPTGLIEKEYVGKIYKKHNHIAVDCGAFFKDCRLGCICLDTMEEFYVCTAEKKQEVFATLNGKIMIK